MHLAVITRHRVAVGQIKPRHGDIANIHFDISGLLIFHAIGEHRQSAADIVKGNTAGHRHAIIGFLAMGVDVISRIGEQITGEVFIHGFDFLHKQDVGFA